MVFATSDAVKAVGAVPQGVAAKASVQKAAATIVLARPASWLSAELLHRLFGAPRTPPQSRASASDAAAPSASPLANSEQQGAYVSHEGQASATEQQQVPACGLVAAPLNVPMHGALGSMGSPDAIDKLCAEVDAGSVGIVQGADRMETLLFGSALMYEEEVSPRYVGCHTLNRDRHGGSGLEFLELLSQIAEIHDARHHGGAAPGIRRFSCSTSALPRATTARHPTGLARFASAASLVATSARAFERCEQAWSGAIRSSRGTGAAS